MKPRSSSLHVSAEFLDADSADLDETVDLPALFLPGDPKDCNDDDANPSLQATENESAQLIELGESINRNLERIAAALENLPKERGRVTKKRKVAAKPKTTAEKPAVTRKTRRKKAAKKTTRKR
jgi:hypothetical protein